MKEIIAADHTIRVDGETIHFEGTMRLSGTEAYAPIQALMAEVLSSAKTGITLDLTGLEFLNSSGINLLAKFAIDVRNQQTMALTVLGASRIPWQPKSLPNLKRLFPATVLQIT